MSGAEPAVAATRCCRRCEYWDTDGLHLIETAKLGRCLNVQVPAIETAPDMVCDGFSEDTNEYG